ELAERVAEALRVIAGSVVSRPRRREDVDAISSGHDIDEMIELALAVVGDRFATWPPRHSSRSPFAPPRLPALAISVPEPDVIVIVEPVRRRAGRIFEHRDAID